MTRECVLEKLNQIFRDVFDDATIELSDESDSSEIEDWDSLAQIDLIISIEDCFGIKVTLKEANKMNNVGEMVDYLMTRLAWE